MKATEGNNKSKTCTLCCDPINQPCNKFDLCEVSNLPFVLRREVLIQLNWAFPALWCCCVGLDYALRFFCVRSLQRLKNRQLCVFCSVAEGGDATKKDVMVSLSAQQGGNIC